jgi:hypothetical protein
MFFNPMIFLFILVFFFLMVQVNIIAVVFREIGILGAPVASIGGAGTFDGIFLNGILAVLLSSVLA